MKVTLHNHQLAMNDGVKDHMIQGFKSILLCGPTGIGKSRMAAAQIEASLAKGKRQAFVVPRRELLKQIHETLESFDIPHSYVAAGYPFNPYARTFVCTSGTLINRLDRIDPDLIFFDETHHGGEVLDELINYYKARGKYIIGLSATPKKMNGQGLDKWYDRMVLGPTTRWLMDNGYLSDYKIFAPSSPNLSGLKRSNGDYAKGQLQEMMEQNKVLVGDAVNHYKKHANGLLNLAFCTSIKHSEMTAEMFRQAGVPAAHIDGKMKEHDRTRIIRAFARRELKTITSVDLILFGWDLALNSGMPVSAESMSDLRPTLSDPLQLQKWGRVLRKKDNPAIICDHAANCTRFGLPDDDRHWTLEGSEKESREGVEKLIPAMVCESCFAASRPFVTCPKCGHTREVHGREVEHVEGDLQEIDREAARKQARINQGRAKTEEELIKQFIAQGSTPWNAKRRAGYVLAARAKKESERSNA